MGSNWLVAYNHWLRVLILLWLTAPSHSFGQQGATYSIVDRVADGLSDLGQDLSAAHIESRFRTSDSISPIGLQPIGRKLLLDRPRYNGYCSKADIIILQGRSSPTPGGIPTFSVQILNMCGTNGNSNRNRNSDHYSNYVDNGPRSGGHAGSGLPAAMPCGAAVSDVHVSCGWFASAKLVNPRVFRRIKFDDCLVNDGLPIRAGHAISFQYSNSFQYPLSVTTAITPPASSTHCGDDPAKYP